MNPYHRTTRRFAAVMTALLPLLLFWMLMMVTHPPDFLVLAVADDQALPGLYRPLAVAALTVSLAVYAVLVTAVASGPRSDDGGARLSHAAAWLWFAGLSVYVLLGFAMLGAGVDCSMRIEDGTPWDWTVCVSGAGDGSRPTVYGLSHLFPYLPAWTVVLVFLLRTGRRRQPAVD